MSIGVDNTKLVWFLRGRRHGGLVGVDNGRLPAPDTLFRLQAEADADPKRFPQLPKAHQPIAVAPPENPADYR